MDQLSKELSIMGRLMDAASMRTRVIARNLANVNTPNYKRSRVVFEEALGEALARGNRSALEKLRPRVVVEAGGELKANGNNVQMEEEMADLVKATILYNVVDRIMTGKIKSLRLAIQGQ